MSGESQVQHFSNEVDRIVDRFRKEYDMSYAEVVGVLHMKAHLLCNEAENREDEVSDE